MLHPKISATFFGGVADRKNPTGSCHLFEIRRGKNLTRILVDGGMWQGNKEVFEKNSLLPPRLDKVDCIILTHSHTDHAGRIPFFVKHGFCGPVFCTKATASLLGPMLYDTAKILQQESRAKNHEGAKRKDGKQKKKKKSQEHQALPQFVFDGDDVEASLELIKSNGFDYFRWIRLDKGIFLKFYPSGHVLGGAICVLRVDRNSNPKNSIYIGLSGDLGREDGIILPPPAVVRESLDCWLTESTYGGVKHPPREDEISALLELIKRAKDTGGKILIPSFSLERTQELLYILAVHMSRDDSLHLPIFLDSPLANKITGVFSAHWKTPMFKDQASLGFNPFSSEENPFLGIVLEKEDSANLINTPGPHIIIAGSGMCDAGRIREHLRYALPNSRNTVCLVGYMAEGTLGRKLWENPTSVRMNKEEIPVQARISRFRSYSAHADGSFLTSYAKKLRIKMGIIILHGENKNAQWLRENLQGQIGNKLPIYIPRLGETISLF